MIGDVDRDRYDSHMDPRRAGQRTTPTLLAVCAAAAPVVAGFDGMPTALQVEMLVIAMVLAGALAVAADPLSKNRPVECNYSTRGTGTPPGVTPSCWGR